MRWRMRWRLRWRLVRWTTKTCCYKKDNSLKKNISPFISSKDGERKEKMSFPLQKELFFLFALEVYDSEWREFRPRENESWMWRGSFISGPVALQFERALILSSEVLQVLLRERNCGRLKWTASTAVTWNCFVPFFVRTKKELFFFSLLLNGTSQGFVLSILREQM